MSIYVFYNILQATHKEGTVVQRRINCQQLMWWYTGEFWQEKNWQILSYSPKFSSPIFTDTLKIYLAYALTVVYSPKFSLPIAFTCTVCHFPCTYPVMLGSKWNLYAQANRKLMMCGYADKVGCSFNLLKNFLLMLLIHDVKLCSSVKF